jgi:opacity protein-like surface antigen
MKRIALSGFVLCLALFLMSPFDVYGQDRSNYLSIKAGIYSPTGDLDDEGFDDGFNGEITYGHYFNSNFALEGAIGYFASDASLTEPDPFGPIEIDIDIWSVPITLTAKGIYPINRFELYGGAGLGLYLWKADVDASQAGLSDSDSDGGVEFGFHLLAGVNYNISDTLFLGVEGKYILTGEAEPEFDIGGETIKEESDLNGYMLTAVVGFRF